VRERTSKKALKMEIGRIALSTELNLGGGSEGDGEGERSVRIGPKKQV